MKWITDCDEPSAFRTHRWSASLSSRHAGAISRTVKPWLLPLWNSGHLLARRAGAYLDALSRRRFERCAACGRFGPMLYHRGVIPPRLEQLWGLSPELANALARKESCACFACGAKLRARRLARVLLELFPVGEPATPAASVRAWAATNSVRTLRVAEFNRIDGLHEQLAGLPELAYSEYLEGVEPGTIVAGTQCEDLTRLTYPAASFDLVLSSETLEHVPDLDSALGEIHRVLRPGGWHLFTVPWLPGVPRTYARASVRPDGTIEHHAPELRHPGGDVGYFVFTEFGADLPERLEQAGFEVTVWFGPPSAADLGQVLATRRPAALQSEQQRGQERGPFG